MTTEPADNRFGWVNSADPAFGPGRRKRVLMLELASSRSETEEYTR